MELNSHQLLTLNYWQDSVTYEGHTVPTGTLGCAALNIPAEVINRLDALCAPINLFMGMVQAGQGTPALLTAARESALHLVDLLKDVPPFNRIDANICQEAIHTVFTEDTLDKAAEYVSEIQNNSLAAAFDDRYRDVLRLLRYLPVMGHMGFAIRDFKCKLTDFAELLNRQDSDRTPDGYAAAFGRYFSNTPTLAEDDPSWMSLANISVQYVAVKRPGADDPRLVKRMHFVSFVGMFRTDLYEGLCVGHAPKKCAICGKWFLTTDARRTKYCGGLAPGDKLGRTCRQIGNLRGRAQRELADDHPLKAIYERRMNTITQKLRRGTINESLALRMKKLAKDKLERAISDPDYAANAYAGEMEQETLMAEAQK